MTTIGTRKDDQSACRPGSTSFVLRLAPTERSLRIETDDARVAAYVRAAYGNLRCTSRFAVTDTAELICAATPAHVSFNGSVIDRTWRGTGENPWRSGAYAIDQFVWRSFARDTLRLAFYACAVIVDGRAVLLAGEPGSGKTTLALALTRFGARVIGDEMILLDRRSAGIAALDRALSIRWRGHDPLGNSHLAGVIRRHGVPVGSGLTEFLAVDRRAFGEGPYSAPLAATFVLTRGDGPARIAPRSAARTAIGLARYLGSRPESVDDVASLSAVLERGACFTVCAGEPHSTAGAILEALRAC